MRMRYDDSRVRRTFDLIRRQYPFAVSVALNQTANDFQRVQQEAVLRDFTVRQKTFVLNSIKRLRGVDFATKTSLVATVRVDPARNQLAKFERGGEKVSLQGKPYVAVPARDLRRTKRGLVPRSLYPAAFKPLTDQPGGITLGQQRTFIVPVTGGNRLMLQRQGKARVRALYLFTPSVTIDDRLHFHEHAMAVAKSSWAPNMNAAWRLSLRTAR